MELSRSVKVCKSRRPGLPAIAVSHELIKRRLLHQPANNTWAIGRQDILEARTRIATQRQLKPCETDTGITLAADTKRLIINEVQLVRQAAEDMVQQDNEPQVCKTKNTLRTSRGQVRKEWNCKKKRLGTAMWQPRELQALRLKVQFFLVYFNQM